jgi:cobalt-zinc-cadmium efflux system membrane fusion protein
VVAPEESRVAHIRPLARGLIEDVSVSLGSRVDAGQALITFDNIELGELIGTYLSEKAALQQTQSDLDVKSKTLDRAQELIKLEAIAQQTLDLRRAEMQNAEAGVTSQRARVAKVEEQIHRFGLTDADLGKLTTEEGRSIHRTASHSVIRAPFAGVITKYDVAKGEVVQPDHELFTLTNLTTVWVQADVYEKDLGRIQRDSDVAVKVEAYPDRSFVGRLTFIADLIDPKTRTAKVRCVVANSDGALKLDMFARIAIPTKDQRQSVVVPQVAVQNVDNQPVVFVRRTATQFERRDVRVGASSGDQVEILDGLKAGETVVAAGSFYFKTALLRERIGGE